MRRSRTRLRTNQGPVPETATATVEVPLPLLATLRDVRDRFFALCVAAGRQVLAHMMEQDRIALCGPKWVPNPRRRAGRAGTTSSEVTLGGRRIPLKRPRVRSVRGHERALPSFLFAADRDPLDARTFDAMTIGVATRQYQRSLDALPTGSAERAVSRSAVSRRFVALSTQLLAQWLARPLHDLDLRVVLLDGIAFRGHCILIALGITATGMKRVLGLREGTTENTTVAKALLGELIERGLPTDRALLFGIDGGKGLRKAIAQTFGALAVVHRCQLHKRRNVREHLPEHLRPATERALCAAYVTADAADAQRQLERLARSLDRTHPGAAASVREGLAETLTLQRLGITGALYQTLRSTNAIENLNGTVAHVTRNVRRWRDGAMLVRWVGTALSIAEHRFRRLRGYRDMPKLVAALRRHEAVVRSAGPKKMRRAA